MTQNRCVIYIKCRWYRTWTKFIQIWALYSSFFTPLEFGFFRGLPENLFILDIVGQVAFLLDIILHFFLAYRDSQTYRMVCKPTSIAIRYLKSNFLIDLLGCMPWDMIYKVLLSSPTYASFPQVYTYSNNSFNNEELVG
ncbi:potassium channel SKOR-like [Hibiscus syriacus]|uniref:potassium channel SKOR-like n=1 Tax=Hibiscus syriacus TaxID=106335 RepID=UPI0019207351|nr:potassium channel SKOR-like [Hibiscus syriacus]